MKKVWMALIALVPPAAFAAGIGARAEMDWAAFRTAEGFDLRFEYSRVGSRGSGLESVAVRLDCGEAERIPPEGAIPWDVALALEPELEAFVAREAGVLERLAADESCDWVSRERIRGALEARSLLPVLTNIKFETERALLEAFRAAAARGDLPAPIRKDAGARAFEEEILLVTHASRAFDANGAIRAGLDRAIGEFRSQGRPVVFLIHDDRLQDFTWLSRERRPDLALRSRSGEHELSIRAPRVSVAGGYLSLCQARSVALAAASYFKNGGKEAFRVRYPLDATYEERHAFLPRAPQTARERLLRLEGAVTLRALLKAAGPRAFARSLEDLQLVDSSLYRVRVIVDGKPVHRWGKGKREVRLEFE